MLGMRGANREAWIVDAVRTPFGRHGGALSSVRPDDLAARVLRELVIRNDLDAADVEDVVLGCANQAGEDNRDVARMAALLAGLPVSVPGSTVNRLCGSGMEAVTTAWRSLLLGDGDLFLAGGVESMSRAPWVLPKPTRAFPVGASELADTTLGWRLVNSEMERMGHTDSLGQTAENLAAEHSISREEQDRFALASHRKAVRAAAHGIFDRQLLPVETTVRRERRTVSSDEGPRADTTLEQLSRLRSAFRSDGGVTAGNSSPLNDGAAALVIASSDYARAHGMRPLARIRSAAVAGVPPRVMGIGPVPATAKALERAGVTLDEIDLIEANEAFAAQALAVTRAWRIDPEDERLNPNGGAIALGHPLGASGARLVGACAHELRRRSDARLALATMCIGVGQGIAVVLERVED